jgi:hypothetical protein
MITQGTKFSEELIVPPFSSFLIGGLDNGEDCPETLLWEVVNCLSYNPRQRLQAALVGLLNLIFRDS